MISNHTETMFSPEDLGVNQIKQECYFWRKYG